MWPLSREKIYLNFTKYIEKSQTHGSEFVMFFVLYNIGVDKLYCVK